MIFKDMFIVTKQKGWYKVGKSFFYIQVPHSHFQESFVYPSKSYIYKTMYVSPKAGGGEIEPAGVI